MGTEVDDAGFLADEATIPGVVERAAHAFGPDPALVGEDGTTLDYATLWSRARRGAAALAALGVAPGDRVALLADNSPAWALAHLAILCTGAAVVPIGTRWRDAEVAEVLDRARCAAVLREDDLATLVERGDATAPARPGGPAEIDDRLRALDPDAVSHVQYTSGTTGRPKGACLTHRGMVTTTRAWVRVVGLRRHDRYPIVNPCSHIAGHKTGLLACAVAGATAYPIARFDPERLGARIRAEGITFLQGPPAMFTALLDALEAAHTATGEAPPATVRVAVTGSANIPPALVVRMRDTLGLDAVHAGYGLTEATGVCTITRAGDPLDLVTRTSGRPVPGVEVRVVDPDTRATVPAGTPGEIHVRGPGVMRGYLDDPAATAAVIDAGGWLATGDVGVLDEPGNLAIVDRLTDVVIVGGFNAYPAEIERALTEHPAVAQAAVVGVPDDRLGEVPVAFVVVADGTEIAAGALLAWVHERLAPYKVPRHLWLVDALPLTAVPKVDKVALADRARDLVALNAR